MVRRVITGYSKFFSSINQLKPRLKMHAELQGMQSFLVDICEVSALAEERGIMRRPSFDQLLHKANEVGLAVPASSTLDELREAAEEACERIKGDAS